MTFQTSRYHEQFTKRMGVDVTLENGSVVKAMKRDLTDPEVHSVGGGRDRTIRLMWVPTTQAFPPNQVVTIGLEAFYAIQAHGDDDGWTRYNLNPSTITVQRTGGFAIGFGSGFDVVRTVTT